MVERALSLTEAADSMGWSRRTLTRALAQHGIATIGTGRRARLEASDLELLKAKERGACNSTRQEPVRGTGPTLSAPLLTDAKLRRYWKRRSAQMLRKRPATSSRVRPLAGVGVGAPPEGPPGPPVAIVVPVVLQ